MPVTTGPFFGIQYGWDLGASNWGDPVNTNLQIMSFLDKGAVDDFVAVLPGSPAIGDSVVLTTDNKLYVWLGSWLFITPQEGMEVNKNSDGTKWKYNGATWVETLSEERLASDEGSSLVGFVQNGTGAILRDSQEKHRERVSVEDYGPANDTSVQKAINYLASIGGGVLDFNNSSYTFSAPVKLPVNLSKTLTINGNGATLSVQAGARCFDIDKLADYDTVRNIFFTNFMVDASAMTGRNHVFFGTYQSNVHQQRLNFDNVHFDNIKITGPAIDPTLVKHPIGFFLASVHPTSNEITQTTIKNISFNNVKIAGCNAGFLVAGLDLTAATEANVFIDDISIKDCRHVESSPSVVFFSSSHIQIGQDAMCGNIYISDFYGQNSGDNSIELNNCRNAAVTNAYADGCFNLAFYVRNYNPNFDPTDQVVVYKNCSTNVTGDRAFVLGYAAGSAGLGSIVLDDCTVTMPDTNDTNQAGYAVFAGVSSTVPFNNLSIKNLKVVREVSQSLTASVFPATISVRPASRATVKIRDFKTAVTGSVTLNGFQYNHRLLNAFGSDLVLDMDVVDFEYNVTGGSAIRGVSTGENVGDSVSAEISRYIVSSNVVCTTLTLSGSAVLDRKHSFVLNDCDFSSAGTALPISYGTTAMRDFVRLRNVYISPEVDQSNIAPGASPFTFKNAAGYPVMVTVSGGTVSAVDIAPLSTFSVTGLTAGAFVLENGHSLKVTYTVAPTMKNIPLWQS